jgi:hypothetical protein
MNSTSTIAQKGPPKLWSARESPPSPPLPNHACELSPHMALQDTGRCHKTISANSLTAVVKSHPRQFAEQSSTTVPHHRVASIAHAGSAQQAGQ